MIQPIQFTPVYKVEKIIFIPKDPNGEPSKNEKPKEISYTGSPWNNVGNKLNYFA